MTSGRPRLVTAEGTRAVHERARLLSVVDSDDMKHIVEEGFILSREATEEVLRELIDTRLLTSCEVREDELGLPLNWEVPRSWEIGFRVEF